MKKGNERDRLMDMLYKKAVGYVTQEVVEEFGGDSGELIKRKVTCKPIPPDVSALKTYLELVKAENEFANLSDEQLEIERVRLIKSLQSKK